MANPHEPLSQPYKTQKPALNARKKKKRRAGKSLQMMTAFILVILLWFFISDSVQSSEQTPSGTTDRIFTTPSPSPPAQPRDISTAAASQPPSLEAENWMLKLVNAENPLPDGHSPALQTLSNGLLFDERAIGPLSEMLSAARAQGLSPIICSAYRSIEKQRFLFDNQVESLVSLGRSREVADAEARQSVAFPGTSEHNLGLAADIVAASYQLLDDNQADTPESIWLHEHCAEFGFILRYPRDKTEITGVIYEPWHFRYVGVEAAKEIMENGLCLEEYQDLQQRVIETLADRVTALESK